jgi:hypothetical protein
MAFDAGVASCGETIGVAIAEGALAVLRAPINIRAARRIAILPEFVITGQRSSRNPR